MHVAVPVAMRWRELLLGMIPRQQLQQLLQQLYLILPAIAMLRSYNNPQTSLAQVLHAAAA